MGRKKGYHDLFARVPEELWKALCAEAEREDRSATNLLIQILKARYPDAVQKKRPRPER